MTSGRRAILIICVIIVIRGSCGELYTCAPVTPKVVFVSRTHPEMPPVGFLNGELGVLQSSYDYMYLALAYRQLKGNGLAEGEIQSVLNAVKNNILGRYRWHSDWGPQENERGQDQSWYWPGMDYNVMRWMEERAKVETVALPRVMELNPVWIIFSTSDEEAAQKVSLHNPGYLTIMYHSLRLLVESGEYDNSRNRLDDIIIQYSKKAPPSAMNQFLALRMKLSANIEEFL